MPWSGQRHRDAFGQGLTLLGTRRLRRPGGRHAGASGPAVKAQELAAFLPEGAPEGRALLTVLAENKRRRFAGNRPREPLRDALEQSLDVEVVLAQPTTMRP